MVRKEECTQYMCNVILNKFSVFLSVIFLFAPNWSFNDLYFRISSLWEDGWIKEINKLSKSYFTSAFCKLKHLIRLNVVIQYLKRNKFTRCICQSLNIIRCLTPSRLSRLRVFSGFFASSVIAFPVPQRVARHQVSCLARKKGVSDAFPDVRFAFFVLQTIASYIFQIYRIQYTLGICVTEVIMFF